MRVSSGNGALLRVWSGGRSLISQCTLRGRHLSWSCSRLCLATAEPSTLWVDGVFVNLKAWPLWGAYSPNADFLRSYSHPGFHVAGRSQGKGRGKSGSVSTAGKRSQARSRGAFRQAGERRSLRRPFESRTARSRLSAPPHFRRLAAREGGPAGSRAFSRAHGVQRQQALSAGKTRRVFPAHG